VFARDRLLQEMPERSVPFRDFFDIMAALEGEGASALGNDA
jgi:hypothetical protein